MKIVKPILAVFTSGLLLIVIGLDLWGALTLGTIIPNENAVREPHANRVVMVFGATGSVGDGLLKAALEDAAVEKVYAVTRRSSERIESGVKSGKLELHIHQDFSDFTALTNIIAEVNTVLWGLGTSSIGSDDATYTRINVDFPLAFTRAWLDARQIAPMSFHYITGMGTDPEGKQHWAREKARAEATLASMANNTELRTFAYRSAFVRPTSERANAFHYLIEALLRPGALVIPALELGQAMLEISGRRGELANGTLIDNKDSIAFARAYQATARAPD